MMTKEEKEEMLTILKEMETRLRNGERDPRVDMVAVQKLIEILTDEKLPAPV
jgi:hypothetical protein